MGIKSKKGWPQIFCFECEDMFFCWFFRLFFFSFFSHLKSPHGHAKHRSPWRRSINHLAFRHILTATGRSSPATQSFLTVANLALILHRNTATAATAMCNIAEQATLDLVLVADAYALYEGEETPEAARSRHEGAGRVD